MWFCGRGGGKAEFVSGRTTAFLLLELASCWSSLALLFRLLLTDKQREEVKQLYPQPIGRYMMPLYAPAAAAAAVLPPAAAAAASRLRPRPHSLN